MPGVQLAGVDAGEAEQLALFDLGVDVSKLRARAAMLASAARAEATSHAYAIDWRLFTEWCIDAGRDALGAKPETVRLFLAHELETKKVATVARRMHAIAFIHKQAKLASPVDDSVRQLLSGAARKLGSRPKGKHAMTPEMMRRICNQLPMDEMGARDRALLLLGFTSGLRVSELVALNVEDLAFVSKGVKVFVAKSKTDQLQRGRVLGIFKGRRPSTDPVRWLKAWIRAGHLKEGPLFRGMHRGCSVNDSRLSTAGARQIVKRCCELAGVDPRDFGVHSLRAGMITAAVASGANVFEIMQRSGHRSVQTVERYVRPASLFASDVMAKAL